MPKFINLSTWKNAESEGILINSNHIISVSPASSNQKKNGVNSIIKLTSNETLFIQETWSELVEQLEIKP